MGTDRSFAVIVLVTFVGDCARGILFPVLWPLCELHGGSKIDLGYLVAIFSLGRLLISAPLGWVADTYRHKKALLLSSVILTLGGITWANVSVLGGLPALYIAQFLLGLGTGSLGVTRSYVVEQTVVSERTNALSLLSAVQYAGFAATPILGSLVAYYASGWGLSGPAYVVSVVSLLCVALLLGVFRDIATEEDSRDSSSVGVVYSPLGQKEETMPTVENHDVGEHHDLDQQEGDEETPPAIIPLAKTDMTPIEIEMSPRHTNTTSTNSSTSPRIAATMTPTSVDTLRQVVYGYLILLNFTTRGGIAVYETQIAAMLLDTFKLSQLALGALISIAGILGTLQLVFFKALWTSRLGDVSLMALGLGITGIAQAFVIVWGPETIPKRLWEVVLALLLTYGLGYPVANTAASGAFSKLQTHGRQGVTQAVFALAGSVARILVPVLSGYFEANIEPSASFGLVGILMAASLLGLVLLQHPIQALTVAEMDITEGTRIKVGSAQILGMGLCLVGIGLCVGAMADWGVSTW